MQATLYPGKYMIHTGVPAIDLQMISLLFDTEEDAKTGAVELELEAKGVPFTIEPVDVMVSPAKA